MQALTGALKGWVSPLVAEQPHARPKISKEEAKELLRYTFTAPGVQMNHWQEWMPSGYELVLPTSLNLNLPLEARERCFFDPGTSLKFALVKRGQELLIVFGALNSFESEVAEDEKKWHLGKRLLAGAKNSLWSCPEIFQRALDASRQIHMYAKQNGFELVLTGQSFGGGLASYVGLKLDVQAICFNSLPLGQWVKSEPDLITRDLTTHKITQVTVDGDWLSDKIVFTLGRLLPGRRLFIPSAYPHNAMETHTYIVGTFLVYLGYDRCAKPRDIA